MIKLFAHKGLREFYESGSKKGIQPEHAPKLGRILDRLDASISPQDMNLPGYRLHPLKGDKQDMCCLLYTSDLPIYIHTIN